MPSEKGRNRTSAISGRWFLRRLDRDRTGGFTLVELLIVIVMIGIISGVTAPSLRTFFQSQKLANASSELGSDLRFTRLKAVTESNQWVILFQEASRQYIIFSDDGGGGGLATSPDFVEANRANLNPDPGERVLPVKTLPDGVTFGYVTSSGLPNGITTDDPVSFSGTPPVLVFYPNGSSRETGVVMLHLANRISDGDPNGQRAIVVYKSTGHSRVLKYNPGGNPQWK